MLHSISKANSAPKQTQQLVSDILLTDPTINSLLFELWCYYMVASGTHTMKTVWYEAKYLNLQVGYKTSLTFPSSEVLLVLDGVSQCGHDVLLFESQDAQTFDQTSQSISSSLPLCILVTLQQQLQQVPDNPCCILLDGRDQRR